MLVRPLLYVLIVSLAGPGCAAYLKHVQPPQGAIGASGRAAPAERLNPEVISRFLAAEASLAGPAPLEGPDRRAEIAIGYLQEALALAPDEPVLWTALAEARSRGGDYLSAAAAARQAVSLAPDDARAHYQLGELLHRLGDLADAEGHLRIAASAGIAGDDPHLPHYYFYFVLKELGRVDEAIDALGAWMVALPEDTYPATLRAQLLLESGRADEARSSALRALLQNPSSEESLTVYLETFHVDHATESRWMPRDAIRLPEAVRGLEEVLVADWSRPRLHRVLLMLYERMGRFDRAAEHLRFVRMLGRQRAAWLDHKEADLLVRQHRHREARERIDVFLSADGLADDDRVALLLLRATSLEATGEVKGALAELAAISTSSSEHGLAAYQRARLLLASGDSAGAAAAALDARASVPPRETGQHARLIGVAVRARIGRGELDAAKALVEELEQLDPRAGLEGRVELDLARGEPERAAARVRALLAREPGDAGLVTLLAHALVETGDVEAAREVFDAADAESAAWEAARLEGASVARRVEVLAEVSRQRIFLWTAHAQLLHEVGDPLGAAALLRQILVLRPDDADTLNFLAYVYAVAGIELDEAEHLARAAIEQRAFSGAVLDSLGWVLFKRDRLEESVDHLERAAEWLRSDPEVLDHLAQVYAAQGRTAEARSTWTRALASIDRTDRRQRRIAESIEGALRAIDSHSGR